MLAPATSRASASSVASPSGSAAISSATASAGDATASTAAANESLDAIRQVAVSATVAREKLLLSRIKAVQMGIEQAAEAVRVEAATAAAAGIANDSAAGVTGTRGEISGDGATEGATSLASVPRPAVDRGLDFLKGRLDSMLSVIEADVAQASQVRCFSQAAAHRP